MARILGDVQNLEDFKQKIEKQKKLKKRTINSIKKYLPREEIKFLETQMFEEGNQNVVKTELKPCSIGVKPVFKNSLEKYEWLIMNEPQNKWLQEFKATKEYKIYFGGAN